MAVPILPELSAAPLQAMARASMRHRVTLSQAQTADAGHGAETVDLPPLLTGPFPCLLMMGGVYRSSGSGDDDVNYRCRWRL